MLACTLPWLQSSFAQSNSYSVQPKANIAKNNNTISYTVSTENSNQLLGDNDNMKAKALTKTFSVDNTDKLNLDNQFGAITIKIWDKREIKVDADIKAYANSDAEAQKLLDETTVDAQKNGNLITFKTKIGSRDGNWGNWSRNGKKGRREIKVNLMVYMPASNSLTLSQQYGNIIMDDYAGPTSIKVQYGNLTAGKLANTNNYLSVQYGKGNVQEFNQAKINCQYGGGLTLGTIGVLDLNAQYCSVNIGTIKTDAQIQLQYGGGLTLGTTGNLTIDAQYAAVNIATLNGNATVKQQYNKFNVAQVTNGCKNLTIDADYSSISLGFADNYNADLDVDTNYGGFKYGPNVSVKKQGDDDDKSYNSSKKYLGKIGNGGTSKVRLKTDYGSITLK